MAQDAYEAAIAEGREAASQRRFELARSAFERARSQRQTQEVHFFLARVTSRMEQYTEAYRYAQLALDGPEGGHALTAADRRDAQTLLVEVRGRIGVFRVVARPSDTQVTVNGLPLRLEPDGTLLLPRGDHRFVARYAGQVEQRTIYVPQQREGDIVFDLSGSVSPSAIGPSNAAPASSPAPPSATVGQDATLTIVGGVLLGVGGLAGIVGIGTLVARNEAVGNWNTSVLDGACMAGDGGPPPTETREDCLGLRDTWVSLDIATGVLFGVAGASLVAGVVLLVVGSQSTRPNQAFSCGGGPGELGVACQALF